MTVEALALEVLWDNVVLGSDGDMEAAGTASYAATSCTLAKDAATVFHGFQSLRGTNTAINGYASQSGARAAGTLVTAVVRAKGGDAGTTLDLRSTPSNTLLDSMVNPNTTSWNALLVGGRIAGGDTGFQVRMVNGSGVAAVAYWDDLVIEPWVDETAQLISVEWQRGRDYASQIPARSSAGRLSALLLNPSGRYSPSNASSPLTGKLLAGRKVRIRTTSPVKAVLWQGFLDEIRPSPSRREQRTAALRASGPLAWIGERTTPAGSFTTTGAVRATGQVIGAVLDNAGWPAIDRLVDTGAQIVVARWPPGGGSAIKFCQDVEDTEFGFFGESKDGKIVWQAASYRTGLISQATFSDASGAALSYADIDEADPWREIFNVFTADVYYFTSPASTTLWTLPGETPSIAAGATKEFWATYPNISSPADADGTDAWEVLTATTDYTANTQADGLGVNKTAAITAVVTDFYTARKIALTNTDAGLVYITLLKSRGIPVLRSQAIRVVSEDATSQAAYGKRTFPHPSRLYNDTVSAKQYLDTALAKYKNPRAIVTMGYLANQSSSHMTQALSRDISERITLVANGTPESGAQLGISGDFFIEAEHHRVDLSGHMVRYVLSAV